jgi:hypothetical protein
LLSKAGLPNTFAPLKVKRFSSFVVLVLLAGQSAFAQVGAGFGAGRSRFSLSAGYSGVDDRHYTIVGAGAGYYFFEGFEAGIDGEAWMGDKPHIYAISPGLKYVVTTLPSFKPYVGGFYKRTFYDDLPNLDAAGARGGVISPLNENLYLSAGLVYEKVFDCDLALYDSCSRVYPELGVSVSF